MDLSVTLEGQRHTLKLANPVIAASGTFGNGLEFAPYGDLSTLGGIAVKGLSLAPRPGNPSPRIVETRAGMLNSIGLQNDGVQAFLNRLPSLPWKRTAIIANIYASTVAEFGELAAKLNDAQGVAALEINVSCPNVQAGGAIFGANASICAQVVAEVIKKAPDKFIIVKLSPNVTDITEIARSAEAAGADCISCINTVAGMAIDAKTRKPMLANIVGGLSGPCVKPIALRCVWQVANAVKIPVIGLGGICEVEDIAEFLIAGASAIQVGTANFMCPDASFRLASELPAYLAQINVTDISSLIGSLSVG